MLDARTLLYLAADADGSGPSMYALDLELRVSHRISSGLESYTSLGASADGARLAATIANRHTSIWRLPLTDDRSSTPAARDPSLVLANGVTPRLDGGSLFWVIRGEILCRERILAVRPFVDKDGIGRCRLVLDGKLVLTEPRPYRAFQGWRYLAVKDAPKDLDRAAPGAAKMPEGLRCELRELGLL